MSHTSFGVNPHSIVCRNVKKLLAWSRRHIWSLSDSNWIWTHNHLVRKQTLNHLAKLAKWLSCVVSTYLYGAFDCMSSSITWSSMSFRVNPHSKVCLDVKELLARRRHHICSSGDSKEIQSHNHLVHKWTLNHLAKLTKWLCCIVSSYLYGTVHLTLCYYHVTYEFQGESTL